MSLPSESGLCGVTREQQFVLVVGISTCVPLLGPGCPEGGKIRGEAGLRAEPKKLTLEPGLPGHCKNLFVRVGEL